MTLTIIHPERVTAEVVDRGPLGRNREESLEMTSSVGIRRPIRSYS